MRKGVSTYIAAIFILFIFAAFMASLIMIIRGWSDLMTSIVEKEEIAAERARESLTIDNVTISNGDIVIGVRNTGSIGVHLVKYYVRDLRVNSISSGDLNEYIAVGMSKYITITGSYSANRDYLIVLISSRNNVIKITYPYIPLTPPATPTANITYSVTYAPVIFDDYAIATVGYNSSESTPSAPTGYEVLVGTRVTGDLNSLKNVDGDLLVINATRAIIYKFPDFSSWAYYREINITEQTNIADLDNYTVKIILDSSNFTFSHAKSDGSDIIFLGSDGRTILNSWIESWDSESESAVVWVKIPRIPKGQTVTIYMLYGNPSYNNRNKPYYGLLKVMEPLPASDGVNYRIKCEAWYMRRQLFDSSQGNEMNWHADDKTWPLNLPFSFPYYSASYSSIYVCSNGFIGTTYSGTDWSSTINELKRRGMIAPFWADLRTDRGGGIYVNSSYSDEYGSGVYIRWHTRFYPSSGSQNFAVVLYKNGLIRFDYGRIYGRSSTDSTPVIGVSFGDGRHHTLLVSSNWENPGNWNNHDSVMFWPRKEATTDPSNPYVVTEPSVNIGPEESNAIEAYLASVALGWSGLAPMTIVGLHLSASVTAPTFGFVVLENSTSSWMMLYSSNDEITQEVIVNKYFSHGTIGFILNVSSSQPFNFSIDYVAITGRVLDLNKPLIAVICNESTDLYIYDPARDEWHDVALGGSLISPYVCFDYSNMSFYILNYTHILRYDPFTGELTYSFDVNVPASDSAFIIALYNGSDWLIYAPGGGSNDAYIYATNGDLISTSSLPVDVKAYTCTAYDPDKGVGYIIFGGLGDLYRVGISADGIMWSEKVEYNPSPPTAYPVGLAFGNNYLWVIGRGGGVHKIDPETGSVVPLTIQPPYYPLSEGDRLAFVAVAHTSYLYHVREDGTSEVWVIKVS